jgi:hypothetical protein
MWWVAVYVHPVVVERASMWAVAKSDKFPSTPYDLLPPSLLTIVLDRVMYYIYVECCHFWVCRVLFVRIQYGIQNKLIRTYTSQRHVHL